MRCAICKHGDRTPGTATVTLTRGALTLVVKGVPAVICNNCGEEYVTEEAAAQLLTTAEDALRARCPYVLRILANSTQVPSRVPEKLAKRVRQLVVNCLDPSLTRRITQVHFR